MSLQYPVDDMTFLNLLNIKGNDKILDIFQIVKNNTKNFNKIQKHIVQLSDKIHHLDGYISISNNHTNLLKIKSKSKSKDMIKEFVDTVKKWADKYDIDLIQNDNIFYIKGKEV